MKILIVGANGQIARHIVKKLHQTDHQTVAMIRDEAQADELRELGADEIVIADLEKEIAHAFTKIDAVIFAAGSGGHTGADKTLLIDLWGAIKTVKEAEKQGMKRFVMLSSMGTFDPDQGNARIRHYFVAKRVADDFLQATQLPYTIVRPGTLANEEPTGKIQLQTHIEQRNTTITRADVAETIVQTLEQENTIGKTFEILNGSTPIDEALKSL